MILYPSFVFENAQVFLYLLDRRVDSKLYSVLLAFLTTRYWSGILKNEIELFFILNKKKKIFWLFRALNTIVFKFYLLTSAIGSL